MKPITDFNWNGKRGSKRDTYCRPCRSAYHREHYLRNRQTYIDNAAMRRSRILEQRTHFIIEFLEDHPCVDCGESDVAVLEFDHLSDKSFDISGGIRDRNWQSVLEEIAKCEVVCANCHRRRTAKRAGFARFRSRYGEEFET